MARGKKQYKVIQPDNFDFDQQEIMDMFYQLAGDPTKLDPEIIKDKYERLKNAIQRCNKLLRRFKIVILDRLTNKIGRDPFFDYEVKNLIKFLDMADAYIDEQPNDSNLIYIYQAMKESPTVESYLKVCKALREGEDCIKDRSNLKDTFIKRSVGDELIIFDFCKVNFKHLFSHTLSENIPDSKDLADAKTYILIVFNMLYITTQDIYNIISSPDVDIDKLSEMIIQATLSAKKQIPRCDKAFRLIENSIDLLKNGMNGYYKEFMATGNPTVIFENYIRDLSDDLHIDTQTMSQFKRIVFYFRKRVDTLPKESQEKLGSVFSQLEKMLSILDGGSESKEDDDE